MSYHVPMPAEIDPPTTGPLPDIVRGMLAHQRRTLLSICAGLNGEQLAARPLPSTGLSLLGIVRHLAKVERTWLRQRAAGEDVPLLFGGSGDPSDFADGRAADAEQEVDRLQAEWRACDAAAESLPWTIEVEVRGEVLSLGMIYVHLIAEYARHNGHADLLREAIDGVTER